MEGRGEGRVPPARVDMNVYDRQRRKALWRRVGMVRGRRVFRREVDRARALRAAVKGRGRSGGGNREKKGFIGIQATVNSSEPGKNQGKGKRRGIQNGAA